MIRLVAIIAAVLLLLALGPWPYVYYQILRVIVFAAGFFCAFLLYQKNQMLAVALGLCAIVFNPFVPMHIPREVWMVLNVAGAALFGFTAYKTARI